MTDSSSTTHSLVLNEAVYKSLSVDKKRRLYLYEWLMYLDKHLPNASKKEIKDSQQIIIAQLLNFFNAFPGPPIRHLIAKNISTLFSLGDIIALYGTIEKCNELLKSKEHETQMQQMAKLCALSVIGALYEKLGRMVPSYDETVQILLKYLKSADSQVRIEIVQTFEKIIYGLGTAGQSLHKDIYKQLKQLVQDRVLAVRCASIKCLCEMIKHSTFLYSPSSASASSSAAGSSSATSSVAHELETNVQLGFKALDNSNYDVRCCVAIYLAQLVYYSINQLQQQQLILQQQQQMANASVLAPSSASGTNLASMSGGGVDGSTKQQREQAAQQQQNAAAQMIMNEKIKNTLLLLSNGFSKLYSSSGSFNLVRGAASSLAASAGSVVSGSNNSASNMSSLNGNMDAGSSSSNGGDSFGNGGNGGSVAGRMSASSSSSSSLQINREVRIGATYAFVELANLLGSNWLERNLRLFITHVLNLVNGTKAVSTHLDAVYSRKCVQFVLRSIIGGMLNEKVQLQAARELIIIIDKCISGVDLSFNMGEASERQGSNTNQQHVLICALHELSCILKSLNTSASILISDDASLKMIDKILSTLMYSNNAVKCEGAWCLRTLACSLPALMSPLLDNCMDKLSLIRNASEALVGYGYACAALLGAVNSCPLGIPHLKPKIAFNIGEELLRTASQSNNITLALQKTSIGWLLLGGFMTMGSTIVRKHLPRIKKLWNLTMPTSLEQLESEKKRGDLSTWQLSLETRAGALASIHSFLVNCSDLISVNNESVSNNYESSNSANSPQSHYNLINSILTPIEGAIMLLSQLPNIIKANNNSVELKVKAVTFRLKLYQTLIALPSPNLYESNFAIILRELVAEFTQADQPSSTVTSTLRSVCHSNDSILFANCWVQDSDFKSIEDQLQPYSASGCESLEHDVTYLYQKLATSSSSTSSSIIANSAAILNATTIKPMSNSTFYSPLSSFYLSNLTPTNCLAALPLGVSVIDASIQLYGIIYPKVPNKHRSQILAHFVDCIQRHPTTKASAPSKQALQINIFTAVLGSLKSLAESRSDLGDEAIRKNTLKLVMDTLCHSNSILRCAAGEALGRMTQVVAESHFVIEVAQICFEKLKNSQDVTSRTGYALGLGCLHRYVGNMGAGQHMTSSVSILFGMAQNPSSSIVQVWAIHALYLIIDSGGSMFRNYIEPCVEFIVHSVLSIPYTNRDVFVGLGKLLSSIITFMGPELQENTPSINDMRTACLTTCTVMQRHSDSMIRAEAIQCLQELHLFAPKYVSLKLLVPYLINSLVSKDFLLRKVAVSCLRQLCQKDSVEVCNIARSYVEETKPIGLICLINERGLECLIFKMIDIETNPLLIRDLHDILNSILSTSLNELTLKHWLFLCRDIAISADESLISANNEQPTRKPKSKKSNKKSSKKKESILGDDENDDRFGGDNDDEDDEEDLNDEDYDDSETFQTSSSKSNEDYIIGGSGNGKMSNDHASSNLKLKQITKIISPKWPNRVFAIELIRKIIFMCASNSSAVSTSSENEAKTESNVTTDLTKNLKQKAHFDLALAKKLKQQQQLSTQLNTRNTKQTKYEENYLILFLQELMRIACMGATSSCDPLKLVGLDLLHDLILFFANVEEPNPEFKGHLILEQYQAQVSAALRPQFSIETSAHVTAKACQVCSMWISSGIARDLNDLRRVHQLLVSSLQKLTNTSTPQSANLSSATQSSLTTSNSNSDQLIYSELSLTVEKLAVLRAWAEVYIVAKAKKNQKKSDSSFSNGSEGLLSLVQPELAILSYHWSVALKDYAFLCLPSDYANQLPIEGGAFYHADLVESSKPIYKEHFTKILLAYSIWLNEIKFEIKELPANQKIYQALSVNSETSASTTTPQANPTNGSDKLNDLKEKLFFMLLGLGLETLSNTTGLAQLSDETIENILESIDNLLRTNLGRSLLSSKTVHLSVEILSILYKVKLTRDLMSINLMVIRIVEQINEIRLNKQKEKQEKESAESAETNDSSNKENQNENKPDAETTATNPNPSEPNPKADEKTEKNAAKKGKNSSALIFVILEICVRDLIKYAPNLLDRAPTNSNESQKPNDNGSSPIQNSPGPIKSTSSSNNLKLNKGSFLYMHITNCKQLTYKDVELIRNVIHVLNAVPFHADISIEKRVSLIAIIYHIQFSLLPAIELLLNKNEPEYKQIEADLYDSIYNSFRLLCSTSTPISEWHNCFKSDSTNELSINLVEIQQSALMSTLALKNVSNCIIMKLLSIYFQYCSMKVFEPLNVYEKCKVFICSMRCSDNRNELLCMIQSLNDILINKQTKREIRIILLKEHLSYLLKLTSSTSTTLSNLITPTSSQDQNPSQLQTNFLSITDEEGVQIIKSLLDLLESMVVLMSEESREQETLTIFVHILSMYLIDPSVPVVTKNKDHKRLLNELNDLVLKKLLNLGVNYKQEFKQVLEKWPNLKTKIGNAFKSSTLTPSANPSQSMNSPQSFASTPTPNTPQVKAPKIQLKNFNFPKN